MKRVSQKKSHKNKIIVWSLFFLVLIILAGVIVYQILKDNNKSSKVPVLPEKTEKIESKIENTSVTNSETIKTEDGTPEDAAAGRTPKTPEKYEGQDVNKLEKLTGAITYSAKTTDKYRIRVNIDQFLKLPGTCMLSVISASKVVYTDYVNIVSNPSSGSCEGFDIPLTKLSPGEYNIKIEINANQKTGIIEGKVTI
ncbi:MAG: hypothetical protein HXL12_02400 [Candidatus Nanosynbacter sp.]|nr:hypothetical protein [Candidatus Nanosynbacter sp.]